MPIVELRKNGDFPVMGIWETTEAEEILRANYRFADGEKEVFESFTHPYRRAQWLSTRILLEQLIPGNFFRYDEHGKPFLSARPDLHISVSHTGRLVALLLEKETCGIDIERLHPKIERIVPKFLSEKEIAALGQNPPADKLHIYWCAKEALYKAYGKKNISLRRDIFVESAGNSEKGITIAVLTHGDEKFERRIAYEKFRDCILAWTQPFGT